MCTFEEELDSLDLPKFGRLMKYIQSFVWVASYLDSRTRYISLCLFFESVQYSWETVVLLVSCSTTVHFLDRIIYNVGQMSQVCICETTEV